MKLRDALMNLAITAALVMVIVLVALLLKQSQAPVPKAIPVNPASPAAYDLYARPVRETFEVLPNAAFVETRANEADTLRFRVGNEEQVFVLYFIDAVEASWTHPQRINEQARWFGNVTTQDIIDSGAEALEYVRQMLATRPFKVLTRWERVPNSTRYYALIIVEHQPGENVYLADLIMRAGFARIHGLTTPLPSGTPNETDYMLALKKLGDQARSNKQGVWKRVR